MKEIVNNLLKDKTLDEKKEELLKEVRKSINKNALTEYMLIDLSREILKRPYKKGEKIDIVFLFQSPSFWPSWESVWEACNNDKRFNPIMLVSDDPIKEKVQFANARKFLEEKNIPYKHISEVNLSDINPHIIVLHTPYDGHRPRYLHGKQLSAKGYRTIYIPYGIEISDIQRARNDHFTGGVTTTAWRIYTFSKEIIPYYKMFSPTGGDMVKSFGHPKFDKLNKQNFPSLPEEIKKEAGNRKILLLKVHFPKKVNGKMITPSVDMYKNFINRLPEYKNIFCIFMPHPKFYEQLEETLGTEKLKEFKQTLENANNVIEYNDDDYRPVLMNCDYYIVDRSALMIEAAITEKPILYVSTKNPEKMTAPVQKIVDTYYQAKTGKELINFLDEIVIPDKDPLKEERMKVFREIIPDMKGKSGYLIKEDIINSLQSEKPLDKSIIDQKFTDEFKNLINELYTNQNVCEAKIFMEKERIKKHLSYRLGNKLVKSIKEPFGIIKLPFTLWKEYKEFKKNKNNI